MIQLIVKINVTNIHDTYNLFYIALILRVFYFVYRPGAIQTNQQVQTVMAFEKHLLPFRTMFPSK